MMDFTTVIFYIFAALAIFSAARVVTASNPVHAVLFLVLAFFNIAGLWILLQAEFLAMILVMVYVGAVMVLFLFVVMMLDIDIERVRRGFWNYLPLGLFIGLVMVLEMALVLWREYFGAEAMPSPAMAADYNNTKELGRLLFTDYVYPFELASVVLLVGIIAAVMLTLRRRTDVKQLNVSRQIAVKAEDRLRIVKMPSEREQGK